VLIRTVVAPLLGTNCYVVADDEGSCVVIDPGMGAARLVERVLAADGLTPVAVLLTHGHVDHTWDAAVVAEAHAVPVLVHEADAYRLADPLGSLGPLGRQIAEQAGFPAGPTLPVAHPFGADGPPGLPSGLHLRALHAPGHTEGSTVYLVDDAALTGDVLFAGTIGRCDLPGGDEVAMAMTLRTLAGLDPATRLLPGHGPASTLAAELATNPYLR
jgi:glyoxylase-like metal-dependent hydrolase (beta-lactamase superfamily II)